MSTTRIVVVIATCNRCQLLRRTIKSISDCKLPPNYDCLVIVENGGRFGAETEASNAPPHLNTKYLFSPSPNKNIALNVAIDSLDSALVVFFDDDVRLAPNVLHSYAMAECKWGTGFFGGPTGCDYEVVPPAWIILPHSARGFRPPDETETMHDAKFLGFNWAARVKDLRAVGGFDPSFGPGGSLASIGDETDIQRRLLARGIQGVYVPDAFVWHFVPAARCSVEWSLKRAYQNALYRGLQYSGEPTRILGYPRWMIRKVVSHYIRAMSTYITGDEKLRYRAWHEYHTWRGLMHGSRAAYLMTRTKLRTPLH